MLGLKRNEYSSLHLWTLPLQCYVAKAMQQVARVVIAPCSLLLRPLCTFTMGSECACSRCVLHGCSLVWLFSSLSCTALHCSQVSTGSTVVVLNQSVLCCSGAPPIVLNAGVHSNPWVSSGHRSGAGLSAPIRAWLVKESCRQTCLESQGCARGGLWLCSQLGSLMHGGFATVLTVADTLCL